MKNWQIRHKIFHQIFKNMDLGDDLSKETIIIENDRESIIKRAIAYPVLQTKELYYPGKSYAVAITFAKLLEKEFGEDFFESLNHPDLLYENDPYFKPYSEDKDIYDAILINFPFEVFGNSDLRSENFSRTMDYFYKEFLLHEETKLYAP